VQLVQESQVQLAVQEQPVRLVQQVQAQLVQLA
jgi:hypothetical protein